MNYIQRSVFGADMLSDLSGKVLDIDSNIREKAPAQNLQ